MSVYTGWLHVHWMANKIAWYESAKIGCNYQNSWPKQMQMNKLHLFIFRTCHHCRLMKPLSWPSMWVSETDHPPSSSAFMAQTGSACLRGWPSPKPEVYTASGSVQIKTVIIDLGLDSALFEKVGGGWWGGWCHLWFRAAQPGITALVLAYWRMRENEMERKEGWREWVRAL